MADKRKKWAEIDGEGMKLAGNVLRVRKELRWEDYDSFERSCRDLLRAQEEELVIDLGGAGHMFSTVIGIIAATAAEAGRSNKKLTLRIPEGLLWVAKTTGLDVLVNIQKTV